MPGTTPDASEAPILSVVIPTIGRETLGEQFEALRACTWSHPWEVLAVDNGSEGRTRRQVDEWADRLEGLRYVDGTARRGRSHAINAGAEAARGRYLLFCDDDDLVEPDIVQEVGDAFLAGARAVVFNFNVQQVNPPHVWRSHRQAQASEHGRPMFRQYPAFWGCAAIERDLFLGLGGFPEDMAYAEDVAFTITLHEAGVEPTWIDRQLIHYRLRGTPRARFRQRVETVRAVRAIGDHHPEVSPPYRGGRWRRIARAAAGDLAAVPKLRSPQGRLEFADRLGTTWGNFVADGARR